MMQVSMALYEGTPVAVKRFNDQNLKVEHLKEFRSEVAAFHRLQVRLRRPWRKNKAAVLSLRLFTLSAM